MPYKIAGIDVHKIMLHVVVSDVQVDGEYDFTRRVFGSLPEALRSLAAWLVELKVQEVVMESTAQYWKPVWGVLERGWKPECQGRGGSSRMSGTCIWHKPYPIEAGTDARQIFETPNDW